MRPRRVLFVSGGSGITPVMSMLRTMRNEGSDREVAFIHYARSAQEACYADELAAMSGVRVLHGYTRDGQGDLNGYFDADHLAAAMPEPDAVFVCGPPALVDAVRDALPGGVVGELRPAGIRPVRPRRPAAESHSPTAASN